MTSTGRRTVMKAGAAIAGAYALGFPAIVRWPILILSDWPRPIAGNPSA